MKSSEVSKLLGIAVSAIHYYESEGLLTPKRLENNYRVYSEIEIKQLKMILFMTKMNFSIPDIKIAMGHYNYQLQPQTSTLSSDEKITFYLEKKQEFEERLKEYRISLEILQKIINLFQGQEKQQMIKEIDGLVGQFWKEGAHE